LEKIKHTIGIVSYGSASPLGLERSTITSAYNSPAHFLFQKTFNGQKEWCAPAHPEVLAALNALRKENPNYTDLDTSTLLGILSGRQTVSKFNCENKRVGINIGSSRGATELLEATHSSFLKQGAKSIPVKTSPSTTLGNISSWLGQDLKTNGVRIEHSITCSTALHAVLNGIAWLKADMADAFLVGGSEAPLTDFTIAQIKALRLYAGNQASEYPCKGVDYDNNKNTLILGEGSATFMLEKNPAEYLAKITGWGFASEEISTNTSINKNGKGFQDAMKAALREAHLQPQQIDTIVMHAPGTHKGDSAEFEAIKTVFHDMLPLMTGNKWKIGHSFGASGALSMELALEMLQQKRFIKTPFCKGNTDKIMQRIMVNAMGFGGNAVSIILEK
jgi:3-oxoacyl-[acyl-carrier-protein] synthase II